MNGDEFIELTPAGAWHDARRGAGRIVLCLLGFHKPYTQVLDRGTLVWRCSCGAFNLDGQGWLRVDPFVWRRK